MRSSIRWVVLPLCMLLSSVAISAEPVPGLPEAVGSALVKANIPASGFSAYVQEIGQDKPILAFNADTPRNPASTIKLVTTWLGLQSLGPTYTWKTEALATGSPHAGVLDGDLYLKGYGDPYLVIERFWLLVREIRLRGIREIRGDLVIDNSYFDLGPVRPGDFDGHPFDTYNVLPDALLINFEAINFLFRADPVANRVEVFADPLPANLQVRNQVQLVDGRCGEARNRITYTVESLSDHDEVTFKGRFSRRCSEYPAKLSLMKAPDYAYGLFRALWEESGGKLRGKMKVQAAPAGLKSIAIVDSPPLADVIAAINKNSNNVMARHMLLTLGAERFGAPATVEKGQRAVTEGLARLGLSLPDLSIGNGAGLARDTRISVRSLARLLMTAGTAPYSAEFASSLALAGVDGTARRRFVGAEFAGRMHLKTGTLNGVHAVAGYVDSESGRHYAIAMIQNANGRGEEVQAALLRWVYRR